MLLLHTAPCKLHKGSQYGCYLKYLFSLLFLLAFVYLFFINFRKVLETFQSKQINLYDSSTRTYDLFFLFRTLIFMQIFSLFRGSFKRTTHTFLIIFFLGKGEYTFSLSVPGLQNACFREIVYLSLALWCIDRRGESISV